MWGQWLAVCFLKGFLVAWQGNIQWKVDSNPGVISFVTMHSLKNSCKTPATLSTNQMQNHNKLHTLLAGVFPRVRQFSYGFLVWFFSVVIGCCDYFGFGLVILSWSTLYWIGWEIVMQLLTILNIKYRTFINLLDFVYHGGICQILWNRFVRSIKNKVVASRFTCRSKGARFSHDCMSNMMIWNSEAMLVSFIEKK